MERAQLLKREQLRAFGPVWDGAGVRGFAKEGYWHHRTVPGLSFKGSTFVTKTITTYRHAGNMRLTKSHAPADLLPDCIKPYFKEGMALNAIGLSGPGIRALLRDTYLLSIAEPFFISYMPVLPENHLNFGYEVQDFIRDIRKFREFGLFRTDRIGIQLNITCPNVGADLAKMLAKALRLLDQFLYIQLPVVVKLNLLVPAKTAAAIAQHPACTGLCIANSIPFGSAMGKGWWEARFPDGSPFASLGYGDGGLSGAPLFPELVTWLRRFRGIDPETYVHAGGGIMRAGDVDILRQHGADSVFFASVAMLRPWRVPGIIRRAHKVFKT